MTDEAVNSNGFKGRGAGLTCVGELEAAAARSESAGWPSGSCGDAQQTWGTAWGSPPSPRCLPSLPSPSRSCHCASFDRGSRCLWPCLYPELPSPPEGPR